MCLEKMHEVTCPSCNLVQIWRGQRMCIHRACHWTERFLAQCRMEYREKRARDELKEAS